MAIYLLIATAIFILSVSAMFAFTYLATAPRHEERLVEVLDQKQTRTATSERQNFTKGLASLGGSLRRYLKISTSSSSSERLAMAGLRTAHSADTYFGARVLCPLFGIFVGTFLPSNTVFWTVCLAGVGYLFPDAVLRMMIRARQQRIRRALPDTIDLLVICVDAGLGLDQALLRVIGEIGLSYPDLHQELQRLHQEQRAGLTRAESWQALASRTKVEEISSFVSMILQTERFGTPIARSLSSFSDDLRTRRRQHAEEAAEKTKIKIIFPLVFFIFPCLFIVLLAPALLGLFSELKGIGK